MVNARLLAISVLLLVLGCAQQALAVMPFFTGSM